MNIILDHFLVNSGQKWRFLDESSRLFFGLGFGIYWIFALEIEFKE
jgi:hypothetical protein